MSPPRFWFWLTESSPVEVGQRIHNPAEITQDNGRQIVHERSVHFSARQSLLKDQKKKEIQQKAEATPELKGVAECSVHRLRG